MMDLKKYCDNDFINIPKEDWEIILGNVGNDKVKKEALANHLADLAGRYPPPIPEILESEMELDYKRFQGYRCVIYDTESYLRAGPYRNEVSKKTLKFFRWGSIVSDGFMLPTMLKAGHRRYHRNIYQLWESHSGRRTAFNSIINLKKPKVDKKMVLVGFKMRLQIVANYKPVVAREIYNMYGNEGSVLDFCSGYGGRLVGFWGSKCKEYVGIDPNLDLVGPYSKLKNWLNKVDPQDKLVEMHCSAAEDFDYSLYKNRFDLVFTSPPYFNLERYSHDSTQSWVRYKDINTWKEKFLFATIRKIYPCVKPNGYIIINICDSESHPELRICDDMVDLMKNELGMEYIPGLKMLLSNRPGNKIEPGTLKVAEPMWILKKRS